MFTHSLSESHSKLKNLRSVSLPLLISYRQLFVFLFQMVDCGKTGIGSTRLKRSFDVAFLTGIDVDVKADVLDGIDVDVKADVLNGVDVDVKADVLNGVDVDAKADVLDGINVDVNADVYGGDGDFDNATINLKNGREGKDVLSTISEEGVAL